MVIAKMNLFGVYFRNGGFVKISSIPIVFKSIDETSFLEDVLENLSLNQQLNPQCCFKFAESIV